MTPVLVVLAVLVAGGAVVAAAVREPRLAGLGLVVVLLGSPFVPEPAPGTLALAARLVGSLLAGYAVWAALRGASVRTAGSPLGWAGVAAVALVAFVAGWLVAGQVGGAIAGEAAEGPGTAAAAAGLAGGSAAAQAALAVAAALLALGIAPLAAPRDALRLAVGLLLLVTAAGLAYGALATAPDDVAELALAALTAGVGVAGGVVVARTLAVHGDLALHEPSRREAPVRGRPADEAHPVGLGR